MTTPRILPLSQLVVDRIAAGEVIQRPFSAVKELIENSVDAGATQITITVKGAASFIQVQDNGRGIHPEDLNVICRRFNTSKLREFDDLKKMTTYGFRGEALSSMTHVAKVTITSQQNQGSQMGNGVSYRAEYCNGKMTSAAPSKVAGNPGTTITIEDLFYNVPQRLRALKSSGEEYSKIIEVVSKYALLHSGRIGFICKRAGVNTADVHTLATSSLLDNVRKLHGNEVANEFIEFETKQTDPVSFALWGGITNPNYSRKRGEFILFINGRLVESNLLKRTCDACYSECLPKGTHPFVLLRLELPMDTIDVNVHPTKKEVAFLYEEEICLALTSALKQKLLSGSMSRTFETARLVDAPTASAPASATPKREDLFRTKTPPNKQVRTDALSGGLDRFLVSSSAHSSTPPTGSSPARRSERGKLIVENGDALELESVQRLWAVITQANSSVLTDCLKRSVFVGVVDSDYSLLQYDTNLVVVNHGKLAEEAFYQRVIDLFGRFDPIAISPAIDLLDLLQGGTRAFNMLMEKRALLHEYFYISISEEGKITALPRLFADHSPLPRSIPALFRALGDEDEMNWTSELECFQSIARRIARAYAQLPEFRVLASTSNEAAEAMGVGGGALSIADRNTLQYAIKNCIHPLLKRHFLAPQEFADPIQRVIVPLARLEQLYKIFERC